MAEIGERSHLSHIKTSHAAEGEETTWVILLWLAKNMERFWDSWMDWGSAIFLRNWAALITTRGDKWRVCFWKKKKKKLKEMNIYSLRIWVPFVSRVVVLHTTLHVLQLVQHCEHIDEFAQSEQVGLRHKVFPPFSVAQTLHFATEALDRLPLEKQETFDWLNTVFHMWSFSKIPLDPMGGF